MRTLGAVQMEVSTEATLVLKFGVGRCGFPYLHLGQFLQQHPRAVLAVSLLLR